MTARKSIKTLRELKTTYNSVLERYGIAPETLKALDVIAKNWLQGPDALSTLRLRHEHRTMAKAFDWLSNKQLVNDQFQGTYELRFAGYAALLVAGKRVALTLRPVIDDLLKAAARNIAAMPERTHCSLDEFWGSTPDPTEEAALVAALQLLSTAGFGIYLNASFGSAEHSVGFFDHVLDYRDVIACTAEYMETFFAPPVVDLPVPEFSAFSLASLALSPQTFSDARIALDRVPKDPEGAITVAKASLESTFHWLAQKHGDLALTRSMSTMDMLQACKRPLGLEGPAAQDLLRALLTLCNRVTEARNQLSDAHGKPPNAVGATRSEARLVVGSCLLASAFLLERWEAMQTAR
jgi:hypothetical protein